MNPAYSKGNKKAELLQIIHASDTYGPFFALRFNRPVLLQQIRVLSANAEFYMGYSKYASKTECKEPLSLDIWADSELDEEYSHICRIKAKDILISKDLFVPITSQVFLGLSPTAQTI